MLPGEMMVMLGTKCCVKFHREMVFGDMTDEQITLVLEMLKAAKPSSKTISCFFENMLGTLSAAKCGSVYVLQTIINAHHLTVRAANLFQDSQLRYWWLFSAERIVRCASGLRPTGKIDWPEDALLPNSLPSDVNAAYSQLVRTVCYRLEEDERILMCPWSHLSALDDLIKFTTAPTKFSPFSQLMPYARYYRMISTLKVTGPGVAAALLLPPPNFCIGIDSPVTDVYTTWMVHTWIMYAAWPYFRRMLVSSMCDEHNGVKRLILPQSIFDKKRLVQIVGLAYGTKYEYRHPWNDVSQDVLEEFEMVEFANYFNAK